MTRKDEKVVADRLFVIDDSVASSSMAWKLTLFPWARTHELQKPSESWIVVGE